MRGLGGVHTNGAGFCLRSRDAVELGAGRHGVDGEGDADLVVWLGGADAMMGEVYQIGLSPGRTESKVKRRRPQKDRRSRTATSRKQEWKRVGARDSAVYRLSRRGRSDER